MTEFDPSSAFFFAALRGRFGVGGGFGFGRGLGQWRRWQRAPVAPASGKFTVGCGPALAEKRNSLYRAKKIKMARALLTTSCRGQALLAPRSLEGIMHTRSVVLRLTTPLLATSALSVLFGGVCSATPFFFNTGDVNNSMAVATRPDSAGKIEIEAADDFVTTEHHIHYQRVVHGLVVGRRHYPEHRRGARGDLPGLPQRFGRWADVGSTDVLDAECGHAREFAVGRGVRRPRLDSRRRAHVHDARHWGFYCAEFRTAGRDPPQGAGPARDRPDYGGNGPVTGEEVQFNITFTVPFALPSDHYFFIPQVEITTANGEFLWLSGSRPIVPPGTPFPAGFTDLQSWTRDANLDPDWSRVRTDIVGGAPAPTFNGAFALNGVVPEPGTILLVGSGFLAMGWRRRKQVA